MNIKRTDPPFKWTSFRGAGHDDGSWRGAIDTKGGKRKFAAVCYRGLLGEQSHNPEFVFIRLQNKTMKIFSMQPPRIELSGYLASLTFSVFKYTRPFSGTSRLVAMSRGTPRLVL